MLIVVKRWEKWNSYKICRHGNPDSVRRSNLHSSVEHNIYPERILINASIREYIKLIYIWRIFLHRSNDKDIQPVPCSDEVTSLRLLLGTNSIMLLLFKHEVRTSYWVVENINNNVISRYINSQIHHLLRWRAKGNSPHPRLQPNLCIVNFPQE